MLENTFDELRKEFENTKGNFTEEEIEELTFFGFVAVKDYKEHLGTVEATE